MRKRHQLRVIIEQVEKTHPKLGRPVVLALIATKAKKMLLIVSPRGCGKSTITNAVAKAHPHPFIQDRLSVAGLIGLQDAFTNFRGVVVVDDIAKTQTPYARISTITTLAELVYSHYCSSSLAKTTFSITDFNGSALVNIQPVLLRRLVESPEWEASIQDKTIRYYHLHRPLNPNPDPPSVDVDWGLNFDDVAIPDSAGALWEALQRTAWPQWGRARLKEHLRDLLRASAAMDGRAKATQSDYRLLIELLRPLQVEHLIMDKSDFESRRYLHANKLAVLTEFVTYGQFTLPQVADDYKISEATAYRLMDEQRDDWRIVAKSPTTYAPSQTLEKELRRLNLI